MSEVEEKLKLLGVLARRLEGDAEFMAHALSQYRRQRGLDEAGLAQELGASPRMLARLALCRQPQPGAADYTAQVNAIAEYAHVEPERLAALLNAVEVEEAVQAATVGARSRAAARGFVARFGALIRQAAAAALRPAPLAAGLAGLLLVGSVAYLAWRGARVSRRPEPQQAQRAPSAAAPSVTPAALPPSQTPTPRQRQGEPQPRGEAVELVAVNVNLAEAGSGGETRGGGAPRAITLPAARLRLTLTLPPGGAGGRYEISVTDAFTKTLVAAAAVSPDGRRLAATLDLRRLAAGEYYLRLRPVRADEPPLIYALKIAP